MAATDWRCQQNVPDAHNAHPPLCDCVQAAAVASGVQERVEIPSGATHVVMASSSIDFAVKAGGTGIAAAWPTDTSDGSAAELNPAGLRKIPEGASHISAIANAAGVVTFAFFALRNP
jgi:hypothetical protein